MTDQKISELPKLNAEPADDDVFPAVDTSTGQTVGVEYQYLKQGNKNLTPDTDVTYDIGTQALRWKDVFAQSFRQAAGAVDIVITDPSPGGLESSIFSRQYAYPGSVSRISVDGGVAGGDTPGLIVARTNTSYGTDSAQVIVDSAAYSNVFGTAGVNYTSGVGANAEVRVTNGYSFTAANARCNYYGGQAQIRNYGQASQLFGESFSYYSGVSRIQIDAVAIGSFAAGRTYNYGGGNAVLSVENNSSFAQGGVFNLSTNSLSNAFLRATGRGAFAQGEPFNAGGTGAADAIVEASGGASFAQGSTTTSDDGDAIIRAGGLGSFAQGVARSYGAANPAQVIASASGSFAQGYAQYGTIDATQVGAMARGAVSYGAILASGRGALAIGYATAGNPITASANNSFQFGQGVNALADSLQVGSAGLRFKGTSGAPGAPQNGDFWVAGGYVYVRSNGASIQIAGPGPLTN